MKFSSAKKLLATAALVLCGTFGLQMSAQAAVFNFNFSGTGTPENASGTLTTGASVPGGLSITGITGTYNGEAITGLLPTGTFYYTGSGFLQDPGNDNVLNYPPTEVFLGQNNYLDYAGLSFSTASLYVNIYNGLGGYADLYSTSLDSATFGSFGNFTVSPASSAVPEPSSLLMTGGGLTMIFLLLFFTKKREYRQPISMVA